MIDEHHREQPGTPEALPFREKPCELVKYHAPEPSLTEYHHSKPVFLQNHLYGQIAFGADTWYCSNCHDSVHEWLYWLLHRRINEPHVGHAAAGAAYKIFEWYMTECERLGIKP